MYYILYNPSITDRRCRKKVDKLFKKLSSIDDCYKLNLFEINEKENIFLKSLDKDDVVYLCGGDGTLNHFLNNVGKEKFDCKILFYSSGTGNDFKKDHANQTFIDLNPVREFMPKCYINGKEKYYFANGIGVGLDAVVCRSKMQQSIAGTKKSYFGVTLNSFRKFRPYSLDVYIDGELKHYDNVWLMICNNGRYVGGGMKFTPQAVRDDGEFDVVIVHDIPRWRIIFLFPFVYLGIHRLFKGIDYIKCKTLRAIPDGCSIFQMDGETLDYAREVMVEA